MPNIACAIPVVILVMPMGFGARTTPAEDQLHPIHFLTGWSIRRDYRTRQYTAPGYLKAQRDGLFGDGKITGYAVEPPKEYKTTDEQKQRFVDVVATVENPSEVPVQVTVTMTYYFRVDYVLGLQGLHFYPRRFMSSTTVGPRSIGILRVHGDTACPVRFSGVIGTLGLLASPREHRSRDQDWPRFVDRIEVDRVVVHKNLEGRPNETSVVTDAVVETHSISEDASEIQQENKKAAAPAEAKERNSATKQVESSSSSATINSDSLEAKAVVERFLELAEKGEVEQILPLTNSGVLGMLKRMLGDKLQSHVREYLKTTFTGFRFAKARRLTTSSWSITVTNRIKEQIEFKVSKRSSGSFITSIKLSE